MTGFLRNGLKYRLTLKIATEMVLKYYDEFVVAFVYENICRNNIWNDSDGCIYTHEAVLTDFQDSFKENDHFWKAGRVC